MPSTSREGNQASLFSPSATDLSTYSEADVELALLTQALEIRNGESEDIRQRLLEDFRKVQSRREEKIQKLVKSTQELQKVKNFNIIHMIN